jgi:uncharacterized membrane protein
MLPEYAVPSFERHALLASEQIPFGAALILAVLFVVSGLLVAVLSRRLAGGSIGRNQRMGLRLPSTLRSEAAWHAGQRAFAPYGVAAGTGCAVLGAALLLRPGEGLAIVIASAASIWLVVLPAIGAFVGDLAAKDAG